MSENPSQPSESKPPPAGPPQSEPAEDSASPIESESESSTGAPPPSFPPQEPKFQTPPTPTPSAPPNKPQSPPSSAPPPSTLPPEAQSRQPSEPASTSPPPQAPKPPPFLTFIDQVGQGGQQLWQQVQPLVLKAGELILPILAQVGTALDIRFSKFSLYKTAKAGLKSLLPLLIALFKLLERAWKQVVQPLWGLLLGLSRPRLPESWQAVSNRGLTIVMLGPLLLLVWLFSFLTSPAPAPAKAPPSAPPVVTPPQVVPAPATPKPPSPPATPQPLAPVPVAPKIPVATRPQSNSAAKPELKSQPIPKPKSVIKPQPIFNVQTQVAELTERYSAELIQGVKVDFQGDQVVVQVSDRWYDLAPIQQDALGQDALQRGQKFEFQKIEVRDPEGTLLARNPMVGDNIIVLQRRPVSTTLSRRN